jgi:hypothetical protein
MHSASSSPTLLPTPTRSWKFCLPSRLLEAKDTLFSFITPPKPTMALTFSPRSPPPRPGKRCRAVTDVDGERSCGHKKKRRLRLFLITSRLSPEFSHPASNIVDRGSSKIAVWAKQKALGRHLLRKAAILNHIRRQPTTVKAEEEGFVRSVFTKGQERKQLELARLAFVYGSHDTHTRPVPVINQRGLYFPPSSAVRRGGQCKISGEQHSSCSSSTPSSPTPSAKVDTEEPTYRSPNDAYSHSPPKAQIPRKSYMPLPPSPLGLSNYAALDLEDEILDRYSHLDDDDEPAEHHQHGGLGSTSANLFASPASDSPSACASATPSALPNSIYSDFSILEPDEPITNDYHQVEDDTPTLWPSAFGVVPEPALPSTDPPPPYEAASSPNLSPRYAISNSALVQEPISPSPYDVYMGVRARKEKEHLQEKGRQRSLMFLQFDS